MTAGDKHLLYMTHMSTSQKCSWRQARSWHNTEIRAWGRAPGVLQGWRNNLDIQEQKKNQAVLSQAAFP